MKHVLFKIYASSLAAAERGMIPDAVCRFGVRRLLRQRLAELDLGDTTAEAQRFEHFLDICSKSPVAVVPEKANEQHYEVPPEFFRTVLGSRLKYSCCEWPDGVDSLDEAERRALETTCRRAQIEDGQQILELGCGWGSLSLWMAEHFPNASILSVSNSQQQREYIMSRCESLSLTNLQVVTADMNDFGTDQRFDRVVSVEMFEHMRNHAELLRRISGWLNDTGKLFVHIFCHRDHSYLFETRDQRDWMAEHFFSGGMMPGEALLTRCQRDLTLNRLWRWNGQHYEKTSNAWLKNMDQHRDAIMKLFSDTYGAEAAVIQFNRWRMFFIACAELFGFRNGNEWWVSHYLFDKSNS